MRSGKDRRNYYLDEDDVEGRKSRSRRYFFSKSRKHQIVMLVISVVVVFLIMLGTSYAVFSSVNSSSDYNGITVGNLHIKYGDESGAIALSDSYPLTDEEGLQSTAYTFSIQNVGSLASTYTVKLLDDTAVINGEEKTDEEMINKLLDKNDLKVSVNGEAPVILENLSIDNYAIFNGTLQPGETKKISVRVWIKSDASNNIFIKNEDGSLSGKYFFGKITVEGENTKTYETKGMLMWLDAENNGENGHATELNEWYDLSKNGNYAMNNFTNYTWNEKCLSLNNVSSIGVNYDVNDLETYTVSTSFKLKDLADNATFNIIGTPKINIYLEGSKLKIGDLNEVYPLEKNKLYDVAIVKRNKVEVGVSGEKSISTTYEVFINGEFYKDVTKNNYKEVGSNSATLDLCNYIVYSKALSLNKINNNYLLTEARYGE